MKPGRAYGPVGHVNPLPAKRGEVRRRRGEGRGAQAQSHTRPTFAARALALCALSLWGCGGDPKKPQPKHFLEGSLGQVMDVGYDEARILLAPEDVSLLFVRIRPLGSGANPTDAGPNGSTTQGTTEDYPFKVSYRLLGDALPSGASVDLAALDADGVQRCAFSRNVVGDPRTTLPPIVRGELHFARALAPGSVVTGDFHVTFENGIEAASGRTAFADFSARVQP